MRVSRAVLPTILLLALGDDAEASIAPRTGDVLVSTYTSGFRSTPSVAATGSGEFIVVWQDTRPDVDGTHVIGRKFDQDGAFVGTEFPIDGAGSAVARGPAIVSSANGELAVVWRSDPNDGERPRLLARRIGDDGAVIGTEFQVNSPRTLDGDYYLSEPAAASALAPAEGFVVVWSSGVFGPISYQSYGPTTEVFERRILSNGEPLAGDEMVSAPATSENVSTSIRPDVDPLSGGGFVVTWAKGYYGAFASYLNTVARRLFSGGQPSGSEISVGEAGENGPHVAGREPSGFSVVWSTYSFVDYVPQYGGETVARTFSASGEPLADRFVLSSPAEGRDPRGDPLRPAGGLSGVAGATSTAGEFVVAWTSGRSYWNQYYGGSSDGDRTGIFARQLGRDDSTVGRLLQVNAAGQRDQKNPDVAFADGDTLAIVWDANEDDDYTPDHIYARVFDIITPACGDADEDGTNDASDALFVLQAAVGARSCVACLCDVNSSQALTAADALIVLRAAVGVGSTPTCPTCAVAAVTFTLQSDATCYGAHVEIPAEAVPSGAAEACTADPSLALLGCSASFSSTGGALTFDARGCFLDPADLFSCSVSQSDAAAMAAASSTACGCGCADACPTAPVLCASSDAGPACATPAAFASDARIQRAPRVSESAPAAASFSSAIAAQETVTSSTTCETCCDFSDEATLALQSDAVLTELLLRFDIFRDQGCLEDIACSFNSTVDGPTYARFEEDGKTVDVCVSDKDGIDGPLTFGQCSAFANAFSHGPAEVVRALGADLKPIVPAPSVAVE